MAKLWTGRIAGKTDPNANDFNSSISFDQRLYAQDIQGSKVHSSMLAKQGIITEEEKEQIHQGLDDILALMNQNQIEFGSEYEDIHSCVEQLLTSKIGDAGKKLHTGRSRNDQVALDLKLYVRHTIKQIQKEAIQVMIALCKVAKANADTIMPGYTHLQRAQPITFGHTLMAYATMLKRDIKRLDNTLEMMDECPLGAGALAATTFNLDRDYTANHLGFSCPMPNSLDAVADRDYCIEFLSDLSIMMMHLSRLSEEMILWSSWEFKFIELDNAFSTGSSIMPQKKNPDMCELIRGKTGRVYGDLMSLLTVMKGLPLAYNKDMQEDKEAVFDAADTIMMCLKVLAPMIETMKVLKDNMKSAGQKGFINATDCADYLTKKGMPFRDAYKLTGELVASCIEQGIVLEDLNLETLKQISPLFEDDFANSIDLLNCVNQRQVYGGPTPKSVLNQIEQMEQFMSQYEVK